MEDVQTRYKAREIKLTLAQIRQRPVPPRTWEFWKARLHIRPDKEGFYSSAHFDQLKGLVKALKKGWTIENYIDWLIIQEDKQDEIKHRRTESTTQPATGANADPIEVTATACN